MRTISKLLVVMVFMGAMDARSDGKKDAEKEKNNKLQERLDLYISDVYTVTGYLDLGRMDSEGNKYNFGCGGEEVCDEVRVDPKNTDVSLTIKRGYPKPGVGYNFKSTYKVLVTKVKDEGIITKDIHVVDHKERGNLRREEAISTAKSFLSAIKGEVDTLGPNDPISDEEINFIVKRSFQRLYPLEGETPDNLGPRIDL